MKSEETIKSEGGFIMRCPHCGSKISKNLKYCTRCGAELHQGKKEEGVLFTVLLVFILFAVLATTFLAYLVFGASKKDGPWKESYPETNILTETEETKEETKSSVQTETLTASTETEKKK